MSKLLRSGANEANEEKKCILARLEVIVDNHCKYSAFYYRYKVLEPTPCL